MKRYTVEHLISQGSTFLWPTVYIHCCRFSRLAKMHSVTDRRTDGRQYHASSRWCRSYCVQQYDWAKTSSRAERRRRCVRRKAINLLSVM